MGNRPGKQPVGELRVPRQQWPVEIRADCVAEATPFEPRLAVVPEACDDATERLRTVVEDRPARVVLEPRDRLPPARVELALEKHVSDQSPVPGHRVQRKHACAGLLRARSVAIVTGRAAGSRHRRQADRRRRPPQRRGPRLARRDLAQREPAPDPGRRRCRRGRRRQASRLPGRWHAHRARCRAARPGRSEPRDCPDRRRC